MACEVMPGSEHLTGLYAPWTYPYETPSYDNHSYDDPHSRAQSHALSQPQSRAQPPSQSQAQPRHASAGEAGRHRERGSSYHHLSEMIRSYLPSSSKGGAPAPAAASSSPRKGPLSLLPSSRRLSGTFSTKGLGSVKSCVELRKAVEALDMEKEGKIDGGDLEAVLGMGFGVDAASAGQSWVDLKASCECADGRLKLASVQAALTSGVLYAEVQKMQPFSPPASPPDSPTGGVASPASPPTSPAAGKGEAWRLETKGGLGSFRGLCHCISVFKKFDDDQNGLICTRDLQVALKRLTGKAYSKVQCRAFIQKVDANYNSVIELSEFVTLVQMLKAEGVVCKQNLM